MFRLVNHCDSSMISFIGFIPPVAITAIAAPSMNQPQNHRTVDLFPLGVWKRESWVWKWMQHDAIPNSKETYALCMYIYMYIYNYIYIMYIYKYIIHIYIYWHMIYIYILTCKKTHVKTIWKHVNHWTYVPLIPGSWRTTTANRYPKKIAWNHSSVLAFGLHEPLESLDSCHPNWVWWKLKTCEYRDSWSFSISFNCRNEWDTTLKYTEQHFNPCPF